MSSEEIKKSHPCPYYNDNCPKCGVTVFDPLKAYKEELAERIKKERRYVHKSMAYNSYVSGFNDGLDSVLEMLK